MSKNSEKNFQASGAGGKPGAKALVGHSFQRTKILPGHRRLFDEFSKVVARCALPALQLLQGIKDENVEKGEQKVGFDMRSFSMSRSFARGAFRDSYGARGVDLHLTANATMTSSGAGIIATVYANATYLASASDWSTCALLFDEFRVCGLVWSAHPYDKYSKAVTLTRPIIFVWDDVDSTALSNYTNNSEHVVATTVDDFNFDRKTKWMFPVQPDTAKEFQNVSNVANISGSLKLYSNGLTASTNYGLLLLTYLVRFRFQET
jgi:hypothetical protein